MQGYWNNPKETALAFHNGMFRTGDVGYQDSDGYCYILDRLKDMIVTGGENVYSGEVEAVIFPSIPRFMRRRSSEFLIHSGANSWRLALC
jgi:acyl-CoA synthetase (AMP-forming)/AMP-acid ligase II